MLTLPEETINKIKNQQTTAAVHGILMDGIITQNDVTTQDEGETREGKGDTETGPSDDHRWNESIL